MTLIKLSSSVYQRLLQRSESFDDTPDDVIRRLLDESESSKADDPQGVPQVDSRVTPGSILPIAAYWRPILRILAEAGGAAPAHEVIDALEERMAGEFTERDRDTVRNGEVRWRNRARFARLRMKERDLLSRTSRRGIWEITERGRAYLDSTPPEVRP